MSATFITQQQFDDIEGCISFMEQLSSNTNTFFLALPWELKNGATVTVSTEGPATAKLWKDHSDRENYLTINRHLDSLLYITDHIIAGIDGLSSADIKSPVSKLSALVAPPKPPVFAQAPRATCLQILSSQRTGLRVALYKAKYTNANYRYLRDGIYKVLPRSIDFTSLLVQRSETRPLSAAHRQLLYALSARYPYHYTFGMSGLANLIAQQDRIFTLLEEATPYVDPPKQDKSLARFGSDLKIAAVYVRQARRYCSEVAALRRP